MRKAFLVLFLLLAAFQCEATETRRYRLTLEFSEPDFRWSRTITYREDFHLILDKAPLGNGYWGCVAGVIYPKNGHLYGSLSLNKLRGKSDSDGAALGHISHVKLSPDLVVAIPMASGDFKRCTARFVPLK